MVLQQEGVHSPKFKVGQVRIINYSPNKNIIGGYTRLPIYARGKENYSSSQRSCFARCQSHDLGDSPEHLYTAEFLSTELWGNKDGNQKIYLY